tara:strand:+ start:98 stop:811 length:714 start_codon:yes stop_codon:yes gene_type:complete
MTRLSVNVNKVASLRNARGGNNPNLVQIVKDCQLYGAQGITVHPRPDERHITFNDVYDISKIVSKNYNIEGYPDDRYLKIIKDIKPEQATLVPDPPDVVTSNIGWKLSDNRISLKDIVEKIHENNVKVSLFIDPDKKMIDFAKKSGVDRVEFYTGTYAKQYALNNKSIINKYIEAHDYALLNRLEVNAGHDLDLNNLQYLKDHLPGLFEVSIGHALISDSLYYGLKKTIRMYLSKLV